MRIHGIVVPGKRLGRTIGFPTANLQPDAWQDLASNGVYAGWCQVAGGRYPCMLNIGLHPTVPEGAPTVEIHIFHFHDDIYGQPISVETVRFLRGEVKFPSVEALRQQLETDRKAALRILQAE